MTILPLLLNNQRLFRNKAPIFENNLPYWRILGLCQKKSQPLLEKVNNTLCGIKKSSYLCTQVAKAMEDNILSQAIEAYFEVCHQGIPVTDRKGNVYSMLVYQQPSQSDSIIGRKYVYLRNCNGELARYNIKTGEITVWLFEARV